MAYGHCGLGFLDAAPLAYTFYFVQVLEMEGCQMRDTIDMAREAFSIVKGESWNSGFWTVAHEELEAFEALVRADQREIDAKALDKLYGWEDDNEEQK